MKKKELNGKDLLLSFLYSPGMGTVKNEKIVGRTKIQKMMFLFEKQIYQDFFSENLQISLPEFSPYYFGPFSRELYEDLSFFISEIILLYIVTPCLFLKSLENSISKYINITLQ